MPITPFASVVTSLNPFTQERVLYNKEVQTRDLGEDNDANTAQAEAELRERILRERLAEAENAAAREKELDDESVRLEKEIEADIQGGLGRTRAIPLTLIIFAKPRFDRRGTNHYFRRPRIRRLC